MATAARTASKKGNSKVKPSPRRTSGNGGRTSARSKKILKAGLGPEGEGTRRYWVFSVDPSKYHWDTLFVKGKELWSGIKNEKAQRYLRQVRRGDLAICYHGAPEKRVYALASVASDPYFDPTQPNTKNRAVDLKAVQRVPRTVTLAELKKERMLRRMKFFAQTRIPISPLKEAEYDEILRVTGVTPVSYF